MRKFEVYEALVANWLQGQVAQTNELDYDVFACAPFPNLTFQVKYSTLRIEKQLWQWDQYKLRDGKPDYFVLCGIDDVGQDNWFVVSRGDFVRHGTKTARGGVQLAGELKRFSARGRMDGRYLHNNTIWNYHCPDPAKMIEHVMHQEELCQLALL